MTTMDDFNDLLDGIDPECQEKLIEGTKLALSSVSDQSRIFALHRSNNGIYSLRFTRQSRDRNAVNRYTPIFIKREVPRKKRKLNDNSCTVTTIAVPAANQSGSSSLRPRRRSRTNETNPVTAPIPIPNHSGGRSTTSAVEEPDDARNNGQDTTMVVHNQNLSRPLNLATVPSGQSHSSNRVSSFVAQEPDPTVPVHGQNLVIQRASRPWTRSRTNETNPVTAPIPIPNNSGDRGTTSAVEEPNDARNNGQDTTMHVHNQNLSRPPNLATMPSGQSHPSNRGSSFVAQEPDPTVPVHGQNLVIQGASRPGTHSRTNETNPVTGPIPIPNHSGDRGTTSAVEEPDDAQNNGQDTTMLVHNQNLSRPLNLATVPSGQSHPSNRGSSFVAQERDPTVPVHGQNLGIQRASQPGTCSRTNETNPVTALIPIPNHSGDRGTTSAVEEPDAPNNGEDGVSGQEILMAFIPSVGTVYGIPGIQYPFELDDVIFEVFRHRVNTEMGVPYDYNGWGYLDSDGILHWVDDTVSYETMLTELRSVGKILLMADEGLPHDYHLGITHLVNKITEEGCRDRVIHAINIALSASSTQRKLVFRDDDFGVRSYIIRIGA